jgi:hypothetical protein
MDHDAMLLLLLLKLCPRSLFLEIIVFTIIELLYFGVRLTLQHISSSQAKRDEGSQQDANDS